MSDKVKVDRHLYYTADRSRVVEEGDPASHTLWVPPGHSVPVVDAERLGAVDLMKQPKGASLKQASELANKQRQMPANKSR